MLILSGILQNDLNYETADLLLQLFKAVNNNLCFQKRVPYGPYV